MFDSFSFGHIGWDGKDHPFDVVVDTRGQITERGSRDNNHLLEADELLHYLSPNTKKLIVGTGDSGVLKLAEDSKKLLDERGVQLIAVLSKEAIKLYNNEQDKEHTTALIHSTC